MKTVSMFFSILILCSLPVSANKIDDYLRAQIQKNHIPGLVYAVIKNGRIARLKSFGTANLEWNRPVTGKTVFQLASSTKPFTGIALMKLVESGKIGLSDSVAKYLPDAPKSWEPITIRHLATHTSGINGRVTIDGAASIHEFVKAAYNLPLTHSPGEKSIYGFNDFVVLTDIIEKVTGQKFAVFLQQTIFAPLQMNDTAFDFTEDSNGIRTSEVIKKRAGIYSFEAGRYRNFQFPFPVRGYSAGGLLTSAEDLSIMFVALDSGRLLSLKSLDAMWTRDRLSDGSLNGFGIGWVVGEYNGHRTAGHSGGPALSDILRFPDEKLTIIVLSNGQRLYPYLAKGIADFYFPPPTILPLPKIEDGHSDLTASAKKVLADAMDDRINDSLFTAQAQKSFIPAFRNFGLPLFKSFAPIESLNLIESIENETGVARRYQAIYGNKSVIWKFEFDPDGKIKYLEPKIE